MCSKNEVLMREIIVKYHPDFVNSKDLKRVGLEKSKHFNVESLIEECLASVGGYKFVDEDGYDFTDFSDSKTVSVNRNTLKAEISSVETKIGAIRIVAYNPFKSTVDFFFIPAKKLKDVKEPCYGKSSHKERIVFKYSTKDDDTYGWIEDFRVKDFPTLARAKA